MADEPVKTDAEILAEKRAARVANRTKLRITKPRRTAEDYQTVKVTIDGTTKPVSASSKYLLDQLVVDPDAPTGE